MEEKVFVKLITVQKRIAGIRRAHFLLNFKEEHFEDIAFNIVSYWDDDRFINRFRAPVFSEELLINRKEIYNSFLFLIQEEDLNQIQKRILSIDIQDFLVILGQRITPATARTINGIPLLKKEAFAASFELVNPQISKVVRAFEKHNQRTKNSFWGILKGNPKEKEREVKKRVAEILKYKTWWNVYYHYKHELVYEIRVSSGHGMRWKKSNKEFIGLVEPFVDEGS
ncbi:hypothetical protein [Tenacibaculum maritimum]|uniref:hypothetical protein n=1 Tax=Tenacibaculum maritimum TaxID=107401 RepID=UPI0038766744